MGSEMEPQAKDRGPSEEANSSQNVSNLDLT
jgi:hypothetical protein